MTTTDSTVCCLCLHNVADQKNSHIIPKFLSKSLFDEYPARHAVLIDRELNQRKIQDTPKEDYLLCHECEQSLGTLERIFANYVEQIHNYLEFPGQIKYRQTRFGDYLDCEVINPTLFKLFIYSIVWRLSISRSTAYASFNIPVDIEDEMRQFILKNVAIKKKALLSNIENNINIPLYDICLVKPSERLYPPGSFLSAYSCNPESHLIMLSEFALFFFTTDSVINPHLKFFSNRQNDRVIVGIGSIENWAGLNNMLLSKFNSNQ